MTDSDSPAAREARRAARANIRVRISSPGDDDPLSDSRSMTPAERVGIMWQLAMNAWAFTSGAQDAESPLPRHVIRVQRRRR